MGLMAILWYGQWVFWFVIIVGLYVWDMAKRQRDKEEG